MHPDKYPVTLTISILCICITVYIHLSGFSNTVNAAIFCGAFYKPFIYTGEWWRLFTCGFVHIEWLHLAMNLYSFMVLGQMLERYLGTGRYITILLASIFGGSLFQFLVPGNSVSLGLSGGLYGLMGYLLILLISRGYWQVPGVKRSLVSTLLINLAINLMPQISVMAHLGGFLTGLILGYAWEKRNVHYQIALCLLTVCLLFVGFRDPAIPADEQYIGTDISVLQKEIDVHLQRHALRTAEKLDILYGTDGMLYTYLERTSK